MITQIEKTHLNARKVLELGSEMLEKFIVRRKEIGLTPEETFVSLYYFETDVEYLMRDLISREASSAAYELAEDLFENIMGELKDRERKRIEKEKEKKEKEKEEKKEKKETQS